MARKGSGSFRVLSLLVLPALSLANIWLNELHYDTDGGDTDETIEIVSSSTTAFNVVLYNGSNGQLYATQASSAAAVTSLGAGFSAYVFATFASIENGSPDGICIESTEFGNQLLSYEGTFTANDGPCAGLASTDIGVSESGSAEGTSLQLTGCGNEYSDFEWAPSGVAVSYGAKNDGQVIVPLGGECVFAPVFWLNEIHYDTDGADTDGADTGESVEIASNTDGFSVILYNGSNGQSYATEASTAAAVTVLGEGFSAYVFTTFASIENGDPDGICISKDATQEFFSYGGSFVATDGLCNGLTSTDIGVSENEAVAGTSLQLTGCGNEYADYTWTAGNTATFGTVNTGQDFVANPSTECELPVTLISAVQGSGEDSPLVGQTVTIEGIVVGDFQDGDTDAQRTLRGFFVQEETADQDSDDNTSEGIFVFDGSSPAVDVGLFDKVRVTGVVSEFFGMTQISATIVVVDGTESLASVTVATPMLGMMETDLEKFEGMLVSFPQKLYITEMFEYGQFGQVKLTEGLPQPFSFTQLNAPDVDGYAAHVENIEKRSVFYDDGSSVRNPENFENLGISFGPGSVRRAGDSIQDLTGVLQYSFSEYRVHSIEDDVNTFEVENPRPAAVPDVGGRIKVVSFNVQNYFLTTGEVAACGPNSLNCRGAMDAGDLNRQKQKLQTALSQLGADIYGIVEVENDMGDESLNDLAGSISSSYDSIPTGYVGGDAIKCGIIYNSDSVMPMGSVAILDSNVDSDFIDTKNRPVVIQTFQEISTGALLTVAVCHFKSKGSKCTDVGDPDPIPDDGTASCNETRRKAAEALGKYLATDPTKSGSSNFLILGDLNSYAEEPPITTLENTYGYVDLEHKFGGESVYGFSFDGQRGTLDYALASSALESQVTRAETWHINADEALLMDYSTEFNAAKFFDGTVPFRSSDHDPVVIGINLEMTPAPTPSPVSTPSPVASPPGPSIIEQVSPAVTISAVTAVSALGGILLGLVCNGAGS